ncbi:MAG: hypothetical protein IJU44_10510 [Kiritimatiellae bacterium]|nr:hypothetical protein [Kiritimatiellia bacterium]
MPFDVPISHKKCATCRWWHGERELVFIGRDPKFVRLPVMVASAPCEAWPVKKFSGAMTCMRWSKWEKLC